MKFKSLLSFLAVLLLACTTAGRAQTVPISTTDMHTDMVNVTPGDTMVEIPFTVQTDESYIFNAIAPVNGVAMSVVSPLGAVFVPTADSRIHFMSGTDLGAATPGGTFSTDEIALNTKGVWTLRFTFPAATEKTAILVYWAVKSAYHIGLLTDESQYVVGDTGAIWIFGTEDSQSQAVGNSNPQVTVQLLPSGTPVTVPLKDDGKGPDGQANDDLFAGSYKFNAAGTYLITGSVTLPTPDGSVVVRTAERRVTVIEAPITLAGTTIQSTGSGCAQSFGVKLDVTVIKAGTYVFRGQLTGPDGTTLVLGQTFDLVAGAQSVLLPFSLDTIKGKFGYASPLTVDWVMGIYVDSGSSSPVVRQYDVGTFAEAACRDPISVDPDLSVTETMQSGQIKALNFSFQVYVTTPGDYDISFNIIDPDGRLIDQVYLHETLAAGSNTVTFTEPGEKFANIDGPYRISGILVVGVNNAVSVFQLAPTAPYPGSMFVGSLGVAPQFTSPNHVSFDVGTGGTFDVAASGGGTMQYSLGGQPAGVTIDSASGTMTVAGTVAVGDHTFTITASNGVNPAAKQTFTLTMTAVLVAPTLAPLTNPSVHAGGTLPVKAAGLGTHAMVFSLSGMPAWVDITIDSASGVISVGTDVPPAIYAGLTVAADNGIAPPASETFDLVVLAPMSLGATAVPTLGEWALAGLALMLGLLALRRRVCRFFLLHLCHTVGGGGEKPLCAGMTRHGLQGWV